MQNVDKAISHIKWYGQKIREATEKGYSVSPDFWRSRLSGALMALEDVGILTEKEASTLYDECLGRKKEEIN